MSTATTPFLRQVSQAKARNALAVASGKGGVGKTMFSITLTHALTLLGSRNLLFDADLGLANVDIQLGLMPQHDLGGVVGGRLTLAQAVSRYEPGGFDIVAGRSGSGRLANVQANRLQALGEDIIAVANDYDRVILDLGAGVDRTVRALTRVAATCIVMVTDEPTSLTDAYAFIKVLHMEQPYSDVRIVVNMANSLREGERTYGALRKACEGFLKISPPLLGVIRRDAKVRDAIRGQVSLLERYPMCEAARDVEVVAGRLLGQPD